MKLLNANQNLPKRRRIRWRSRACSGRMTSQTGMGTYLYPSAGNAPRHAPTSIGGNAHVYDLNGNLSSGSGNTIAYDVENRPLTANGIGMIYDGDGIRVKLGNTVYISNLYEIDTSTGTATDYIFFGDSQVARKRSSAVHYYHGDKLGSVNAISDSTGIIVLRKTYAPYGNILFQTGILTDSFGLAGQRLDPTGLYHMGAREMAPNMGLFVTPDPSNAANPEMPQTLNRYAYAMNTPTNLFDPTGYAAEDPETTYDKWSFWTHNALSVAGSFPVLGAIPDAIDLVYTGIEVPFGKSSGTDLGLAAAGLGVSFLPGVDQGIGIAKVTTRVAVREASILAAPIAKNANSNLVKIAEGAESAGAKTVPTVFRQGTFADPANGWKGNYVKGQQWATDNPLTTPNYAKKYGLPAQNTTKPDWVVSGQVQGPYKTRQAPSSHNNPHNTGGATEVLPSNPNDVQLNWFHMPGQGKP